MLNMPFFFFFLVFFFNWSTLINIILATAINGLFFKESSKFQFKEYFFINISNFKFSRFLFNNCTLTDVNNHFLIKKGEESRLETNSHLEENQPKLLNHKASSECALKSLIV